VKVSSKPSRLQLDETIQLINKQTSLTPVHQAGKTFNQQNDKKLVVKIDALNDQSINCMVSHDSQSVKDDKAAEENFEQSSSDKASEFVKTPKVQSLIQEIVRIKANRNKQQNNQEINQKMVSEIERQIQQKQKEIKVDQTALSSSIKEMIDSSMIFTQLKHQSAKLLERKNELEE
jgi:hypothetical protein